MAGCGSTCRNNILLSSVQGGKVAVLGRPRKEVLPLLREDRQAVVGE